MMKPWTENWVLSAVALLGFCCTSCFPAITNFSKGEAVPLAISAYATAQSRILVLPLWQDTRMDHFHSSYVIPASAIGTAEAAVPRRTGMYLDSMVCGGPSTFIVGYLVIVDTGTAIWKRTLGERVGHTEDERISDDWRTLKTELKRLLTSREVGPALRELMEYDSIPIAVDLSHDERTIAIHFVDEIPDQE
jgi:hypothetical protein